MLLAIAYIWAAGMWHDSIRMATAVYVYQNQIACRWKRAELQIVAFIWAALWPLTWLAFVFCDYLDPPPKD